MKSLRTAIGPILAAIALATPATAFGAEEGVVPPDNSAVNQYTETFPTAGGDKDTDKSGKRNASKTLGRDNARQLAQQGKEGRAVAEVAAETAPADTGPRSEPDTAGAGAGGGSSGDDGSSGGTAGGSSGGKPAKAAGAAGGAKEADGSSGLGEVLSQASGSSDSGGMGLWLPLLILAVLVASIAYLLHQRRAQS